MLIGLLALLVTTADTTPRAVADTGRVDSSAVVSSARTTAVAGTGSLILPSLALNAALLGGAPQDTAKKKPALVSYSDWYGRRLTIHRRGSWAMLPLFAASYYTGDRLARDGRRNSPDWVRNTHPVAAGGAAVLFGVNTVTGLWNLWDGRKDPNDRTRRILHSALFLIADAGFAYAGSLGEEAGEDGDVRNRHRTIALGSMGVSTAGWLIMLLRK